MRAPMPPPFSFSGRMRPLRYALWSFGIFFTQHLVALLVRAALGRPPVAMPQDRLFYVMPLQMLARHSSAPNVVLIFALVCLLIVAWTLTALTFRRAADAGVTAWIAACAAVPIVQIPVILIL